MQLGTMLVALLAAGCTNDIVGDWEAKDKNSQDDRNDMSLEDDDTGSATLYFFSGGDYYKADFDIEWEDAGDGKYDLKWECDGDCSSLDFDMDCDIDDDGLEMSCEGDEGWKDYEFEWEKNE